MKACTECNGVGLMPVSDEDGKHYNITCDLCNGTGCIAETDTEQESLYQSRLLDENL